MAMGGVEVRLVSCLHADEAVAEDGLAEFDDLEAEVGGVVEGDAEEPADVDEGRDVAEHVDEIWGKDQRWGIRLDGCQK